MKQVTGSKTPTSNNKVSIRLQLDGHSFSVAFPQIATLAKDEKKTFEVEILSPRTMLVPVELFHKELAAEYLSANGMTAYAEDVIVVSRPYGDHVAVMAVSEDAIEKVQDQLGEQLSFTTPLLNEPKSKDGVVWIQQYQSLIYIKVYNNKLRFAEVVSLPTDADWHLLMERFNKEFLTEDYQLILTGDNPSKIKKLIGRRFNKVICE